VICNGGIEALLLGFCTMLELLTNEFSCNVWCTVTVMVLCCGGN
jgi:hypothetical protein